jgi:hypothetical protein
MILIGQNAIKLSAKLSELKNSNMSKKLIKSLLFLNFLLKKKIKLYIHFQI